MDCSCQKKQEIEESLLPEIIEEEKKEEEEEKEEKIIEIIDPFELNFEKARKIVELCLSKDNLYGKFWNYISSFNQEQFKNLFQGNLDYKNYPELEEIEKIEFKFLLMRFEDYFSILFEWYQDESKYNNIVKLWNSKLCIYKLKDNSNTEIKSILQNLGISDTDNFLFELRPIINNSKESKSNNINLDNYEESMRKLEEIGKKLNNDKNDLKALIDEINDEIKKTEEKEKSSGYKEVAKKGLAVLGCGLGCFLTGGVLAIGYGVAGVCYGVSAGFELERVFKMKEKVRIYKEKIEESQKQKEEIEYSLKDLNNKFNQIQQRFILKNVK